MKRLFVAQYHVNGTILTKNLLLLLESRKIVSLFVRSTFLVNASLLYTSYIYILGHTYRLIFIENLCLYNYH